jgi:hypothetical protein
MAALEILLLAFVLIFLVLVVMRGDRILNARRDAQTRRRTHNRKSPKP